MNEPRNGPPFAGGCACGAIRYEFTSEPLLSFHCHCYQCQRVGGSAFTSLMIVPKADFELLGGEPKFYASPTDSGYFLNRGFCASCGSPMLATEDHRPCSSSCTPAAWMTRAGSSLPRTSSPRAPSRGITWTRSAQDPRDAPAAGH